MAKKIKENDDEVMFQKALEQIPEEYRKKFEKMGVKTFDDLFMMLVMNGVDPQKMINDLPESEDDIDDFDIADYAIDKGSELDDIRRMLTGEDEEEGEEDWDDWGGLPEGLLLDGDCQEYHIRVKLNNAPVDIWRELLVPSNISLELLARVIIEAMGWKNCHLHEFRKGEVQYKSTADLRESQGFAGFGMPRMMHDANKFSLGNVLKEKGDRIKFEYDFGDSWEHDIWIKGIREYGADEEPEVRLLKGKGACPPEDCGGVWGYRELIAISQKKRKTREDKERLEWYGIDRNFKPETFDFFEGEDSVESLWWYVKEEMEQRDA